MTDSERKPGDISPGDISYDSRLGLLVVWTGQAWKPPENLTPEEYLIVIGAKKAAYPEGTHSRSQSRS